MGSDTPNVPRTHQETAMTRIARFFRTFATALTVVTAAIALTSAIALTVPAPAVAGQPEHLQCGTATCEEIKETFNAAEVICFGEDGGVQSVWDCAYELHYACVERDTGETRSGGYLPTIRDICEHICGKCPDGWK